MDSITLPTALPAGPSTVEPTLVDDMVGSMGQLNLDQLSLTQKLAHALSITQLYVDPIDVPLLTLRQAACSAPCRHRRQRRRPQLERVSVTVRRGADGCGATSA